MRQKKKGRDSEETGGAEELLLLVGCLTSQQHEKCISGTGGRRGRVETVKRQVRQKRKGRDREKRQVR